MDEIKIQELIGSLQTYELGLPSHKPSKSLALKTITERMDNSTEEDDVEKDVAFVANNSTVAFLSKDEKQWEALQQMKVLFPQG